MQTFDIFARKDTPILNIQYLEMKNTFTKLSYEILKIANRETPRSIFLKEISHKIIESLDCSELKLLLKVPKSKSQFELIHCNDDSFNYNITPIDTLLQNLPTEESAGLWKSILDDKFDSSSTFFSEQGSFWTINFSNISIPYRMQLGATVEKNLSQEENDYSLLIVPVLYNNERVGLIQFKNLKPEVFSSLGTHLFEEFAKTLSVILFNQYTQALLLERVKELAFLYKMSNIMKQRSLSLENIILQIIDLIPPAWQYPEITAARITLSGKEYSNTPLVKSEHKLVSNIVVDNKKCGKIEVMYTEKCPDLDEGPFFHEERSLLNNIAEELATIISQKKSESTL